jgi:outer membrane protein TolC
LLVNQNEKAKQIALQNYQLVQTAYQAGHKTISELLEAQATLLKAKNDLTDAIISLRVSHRRYNNLGIN